MDAPEKTHSLGVVLVHGIGEQESGDTLVEVGDAMCDWFERRGIDAAPGTVSLMSDDGASYTASDMASAELTGIRWLMVEARWAKTFGAPGSSGVLFWAFKVLPHTLATHLTKNTFSDLSRFGPFVAIVVTLKVLAGLIVAPILVGFVGLALILGLLPFDLTQRLSAVIQRILSSVVGDSFVLLSSPMRRAAILTKVRQAIEAAAGRCESVVVIAHSQGAAIAHTVLDKWAPGNLDTLITYGSGLDKLTRIERRSKGRRYESGQRSAFYVVGLLVLILILTTAYLEGGNIFRVVGACTLFSVSLAELATTLAAWSRARLDLIGGRAGMIRVIAVSAITLLLGVYLLAEPWLDAKLRVTLLTLGMTIVLLKLWDQGFTMALSGSMTDDGLFEEPGARRWRRFRWYDIYSTHDPVSNGEMRLHEPSESIRVTNRGSALTDHTSYWENSDEFVTHVMKILSDNGSDKGVLPRDSFGKLKEIKRRRSLRVGWLRATRYALAGLTALSAVAAVRFELLQRVAVGDPEGGSIAKATASGWTFVMEFPALSTVILSAACGYLVYLLFYGVWRAWDKLAMRST